MKVIADVEALREEIDKLNSRTIALYVTPTGDNLYGVRGDVRASCLSVCVYDGYEGFYVPLRHSRHCITKVSRLISSLTGCLRCTCRTSARKASP